MPRAPHPTGMASGAGQTARVRFGTPDLATLREDGYTAVDMHVHTEHSDGLIRVRDALRRGRRIGASFAVTDHNAVSGTVAAAREADPGQIVVPGIEVSASEGPHLLLYFYTVDDLVDFHGAVIARALGGCPHMATTLPTADVLDGLEGWDALAVAAHPFGYLFLCRGVCKAIAAGELAPDILLRLDGLEGICGGMTRSQNERTVTFAREHRARPDRWDGRAPARRDRTGRHRGPGRLGRGVPGRGPARRRLVWGQEKSMIGKTVQATAVLPQVRAVHRALPRRPLPPEPAAGAPVPATSSVTALTETDHTLRRAACRATTSPTGSPAPIRRRKKLTTRPPGYRGQDEEGHGDGPPSASRTGVCRKDQAMRCVKRKSRSRSPRVERQGQVIEREQAKACRLLRAADEPDARDHDADEPSR